jgi:GxxExxY protein
MTELHYKDEVFATIGAAIEVHKTLGPGFLEAVYHEAMEIESAKIKLPFASPVKLKIQYKGQELKKEYEADMVFFETIIVELKAADRLTSHDEGQLLNYLKVTGYRVGLLINFSSHGKLEWKRLIL